MKKISISKLKKDLSTITVDESSKELIVNNALMHNEFLEMYQSGKKINPYIIWQLNSQIFKQLLELKKIQKKSEGDDDDEFITSLKKRVEKR